MISVSLCMIVKNEEDTLARCLNSIKEFVDEIIIVDTGSTDNTKEIAKEFTDKIYDFEWCYDFAKARNFSFSKATKDYIMWLDADDVVLEKDLEKLKLLKENLNTNVDVVMLKYDLNLDENGIPALTFYRERLLKKSNNYKWLGQIHEVIQPFGNIIKEDISITHNKIHKSEPDRNLKIFEKMIENKITLDPRQTFYYARELYYNKKYEESIKEFNKFLSMQDAWIENKISACVDLYNLYREINNENMALKSIFDTFKYDKPRAEACCIIGNYFLKKKEYDNAIYWYNEAKSKTLDVTKGGFYNKDSYYYIPYLNLCVCYYNLNKLDFAIKYNEMAGKIKPKSKEYLQNKAFFDSLNS